MSASSTALPPAQATTFKRVQKCYDNKQYKQALKHCKTILSNPAFANHGETLAMKALIVNATGKRVEAFELAKLGVKNNLRSHVCWHALGLVHRSDKNYAEALKCYRNALKFDKENLLILRDLSIMQVQTRDLEGYAASRQSVLSLRPQTRNSWLGFAIAQHLLGNREQAIKVVQAYETAHASTSSGDSIEEYEAAELAMYTAQLYLEIGDGDAALACLDKHEAKLVDDLAVRELRAEIHLSLGMYADAEQQYRALLKRNPENKTYVLGLESALGVTDATPEDERMKLYSELQETYPSSQTLRRHPLHFSSGTLFERLLDGFMRRNLSKGVTPLFRLVRGLCSTEEKKATAERLLRGYLANLLAKNTFDGADGSAPETPATLLWTYFILAQILDWRGQAQEALQLIESAIAHTPTLIDLYLVKAKILKHGGNPVEAAKVMDTARELDTADRYLNSKTVKYYLRANNVARAEELAAMFTRQEKATDPIGQLSEMQCMWFEMEEANAFLRTGAVGKALKKLHSINSHFLQFNEDQVDFHSFVFRKATLRSYIRLLRLEDTMHGHAYYVRAALLAIETYVGLHDVPFSLASANTEDPLSKLDEAERKKLLIKQRKAAKRAEAAAAAAAPPAPAAKGGKAEEEKAEEKKDTDPEGLQLAQTANPLDEAIKFLNPLKVLAAKNIHVQFASFEIFWRLEKPLLMLQALNRAAVIDASHPRLHGQRVRFLHKYGAQLSALNPKVAEVIKSELPKHFGEVADAAAFNRQFLDQHKASFAHVLAAAEAMVLLDPASSAAATALLLNPSGDLSTVSRALEVLLKLKASDETVAAFRAKCHALFPLATAFTDDLAGAMAQASI